VNFIVLDGSLPDFHRYREVVAAVNAPIGIKVFLTGFLRVG